MKRKKILLVDDAETVLLMERLILSKHYDIVTAKDGKEALEKAVSETPDLILLDLVMPNMDGFEACKQLREREETKSIPVVIVTTRGDTGSIEAGYRSGCTDYVTKPIDSVELLTKVKNYVGI